MPIRIEAERLTASTELEFESWGGAPDRFADWFEGLARDWRGWAGERVFNDDAVATLRATHDGVGGVTLAMDVRGRLTYDSLGEWKLRTWVRVEPGALDSIARGVRAILALPEPSP